MNLANSGSRFWELKKTLGLGSLLGLAVVVLSGEQSGGGAERAMTNEDATAMAAAGLRHIAQLLGQL